MLKNIKLEFYNVVQQFKSLLLTLASHGWGSSCSNSDPTRLRVNSLRKVAEDVPNGWDSTTHMADQNGVLGYWLQ